MPWECLVGCGPGSCCPSPGVELASSSPASNFRAFIWRVFKPALPATPRRFVLLPLVCSPETSPVVMVSSAGSVSTPFSSLPATLGLHIHHPLGLPSCPCINHGSLSSGHPGTWTSFPAFSAIPGMLPQQPLVWLIAGVSKNSHPCSPCVPRPFLHPLVSRSSCV